MKMWKSETGFTLIELTVVMAVMGVFIAAMTRILMVAFDVHTEIVQENKEQAGRCACDSASGKNDQKQ